MRDKLAAILESWGPGGAFLLALIDSAGIPLPAGVDALVTLAGIATPSLAYLTAGLSVLGSAIGCMILFFVARKGGRMYLERRASSPRAVRFRQWFARYGLLTVFVPALVPVPGLPVKVFVLTAGALGVRALSFLLVILAARAPRYFGLAWLGIHLGEGAGPWLRSHVWQMAGFALVLFLSLGVAARFVSRRAGPPGIQ